MTLRTVFVAAGLCLAVSSAFAQSTPRIDTRQADQAARIEQDVYKRQAPKPAAWIAS